MSTPRFYSWDDDGSPGRALSGNLQNRLKQILVPCLVTGYGSKPGAGWTLEHEHANGFTLSNGQNYINFVSNLPAIAPYPAMSTLAIHVYVAESLTNISGAVIEGANLCSGPYRHGVSDGAGYPRHAFRFDQPLQSLLSTLQWTVIADEQTVTLCCSGSSSSENVNGVPYQTTMHFGSTKNDNLIGNTFAVIGGDNAAYNSLGGTFTLCKGFTAPRNLLTGLAEYSAGTTQPFEKNNTVYIHTNIQGAAPANVCLQSPRIAVGNGYVGRLRGVVYDDVFALNGWPAYLRALGLSGTDFTNRGKVVTSGAYQYAYAIGYNGGFIMTNDPVFW